MSDMQFNPKTGEWNYGDEPQIQESTTAVEEEKPLFLSKEEYQRRQLQAQETSSPAVATVADDRPLFAETPGQFLW